jgi:hypothetical protein
MSQSTYTIHVEIAAEDARRIAAEVLREREADWCWQPQGEGRMLRYRRVRKPVPLPLALHEGFAILCSISPGSLLSAFSRADRFKACSEDMEIAVTAEGRGSRVEIRTRYAAAQVGKAIRERMQALHPALPGEPRTWRRSVWDDREAVAYACGAATIVALLPVTIGLALLYNSWRADA